MEIQGKIVEILQPKGGQSTRGNWKKHEFILETNESFPKKICIASWNDKIDLSNLKPGDQVTASVNIESREYNGNWYTDIKVWKLEVASSLASDAPQGLPGMDPADVPPPPWEPEKEDGDQDLPF
jgi:hypothetical protein